MIPVSAKYSGRRLAVLGLGRSGVPAARLAKRLGAEVTVLDSGDSEALQKSAAELTAEGIACVLGDAALTCQEKFDLAVLSPGIDPSWPIATALTARGIPAIGEVEFAVQNTSTPYIAITGTNGKTTTTELTAAILNGAGVKTLACGNIGLALSSVVLDGTPADVFTIEVSSFQLELIETFRPCVAVWMNFAPDHLDRHPTLDAYRSAKLRIFEKQTAEDTAVINGMEEYPALKARKVTFSAWSADSDFTYREGGIFYRGELLVKLAHTNLRGLHNAENIMAAAGACHAWGVPFEAMQETLRTYKPPRHRCELAGVVEGREFINDSKATNIHAMESALRGMTSKVVLIAGGKDKQLDYAPVKPLIRRQTTHVFTIGEIGPALAECWSEDSECRACASLEDAVRGAYAAAGPGQVVLFAPGTSSFDMFTGYDHRGNVFTQLVHQLTTRP
ncbi:MAG TPA: UDP-N-acetylmuramoyl-L-alanine--D-glutamate ligase [Verrucomicrobiales bacterium]|nr:UDP-N-acetylmuramoyl-L-alanine--D-glutamate ligase [Verrucomicrobiales bacterium]